MQCFLLYVCTVLYIDTLNCNSLCVGQDRAYSCDVYSNWLLSTVPVRCRGSTGLLWLPVGTDGKQCVKLIVALCASHFAKEPRCVERIRTVCSFFDGTEHSGNTYVAALFGFVRDGETRLFSVGDCTLLT